MQPNAPAAATFAMAVFAAAPAVAAPDLDGCWKMVDARIHRQSGKVDTPKSDCIRAYQGATLVTSCRGGQEVSIYTLTDMTVATYSFAQVGRFQDGRESRIDSSPARAAAFRVTGATLHMVLGKTPGASSDPIVRAEQRLARLPAKQCEPLARFLPPGAANGASAGVHPAGAAVPPPLAPRAPGPAATQAAKPRT